MTCSGGLKDAGQPNKNRTRSEEGETSTQVYILDLGTPFGVVLRLHFIFAFYCSTSVRASLLNTEVVMLICKHRYLE